MAARAQGYALRQRPLLTRSPRWQAKRIGARWDQAKRRWYAPHLWIDALERWLLSLPLRVLLAGEDRSSGSGHIRRPGEHDAAGDAARAAVAEQGGLPQSREPDSGGPCAKWLG